MVLKESILVLVTGLLLLPVGVCCCFGDVFGAEDVVATSCCEKGDGERGNSPTPNESRGCGCRAQIVCSDDLNDAANLGLAISPAQHHSDFAIHSPAIEGVISSDPAGLASLPGHTQSAFHGDTLRSLSCLLTI